MSKVCFDCYKMPLTMDNAVFDIHVLYKVSTKYENVCQI